MERKGKGEEKEEIKETAIFFPPSLEIFIGEQYSVKVEMKIP